MPPRPEPLYGFDRSLDQLSKEFLHNPMRRFLRDLAVRDRIAQVMDFKDRNELNNWTVAQTQTSTNFTHVTTEVVGLLQGTTANTTTANVSMVTKEPFFGNNNTIIEGRVKVNTVASTWTMEFGLVDAAPATGAQFVTDIDVPTFVGTNGALFHIDNSQTHANLAFASVGSFTGQTVATTLLTSSNTPAPAVTAPSADTYITFKIALLTTVTHKTMVYGWMNGRLVSSTAHAPASGGVAGNVNLFGWFYFKTIAAAVKIPSIDYFRYSMDRTNSWSVLEGHSAFGA